MCVKCSQCSAEFQCKTAIMMGNNPQYRDVNGQDCIIDFYYVANCVRCGQ